MSKKFRKVLAAILAGTMVLGSGVVANAADAEGTGAGSGSLEIVEKSDIFDVYLPTTAGTTFNYILDPTGVIEETDGAGHGGAASASFVQDKTMYFRNEPASGSNAAATYSNVSDPIKAYNFSTMNVEIKVKAKVATPTGMEIADSMHPDRTNGYVTDKGTATPSIYLALADENGANGTAITTTGIEATSSITGAPGRYTVTATMSSANKPKYNKELDATGSDAKAEILAAPGTPSNVFRSYAFTLTGSCNSDGAWEGLTEVPPTVSLVWSIKDTTTTGGSTGGSTDATTTATSITAGGAAVEITIPAGVTVSKVEKTKADGSYNELPDTYYTWTDATGGKKLTLKSSFTTTYGTGKKIKISFSSGSPIELDVR